jgi:catechol 2,3-dioxygenase-like lactoylglutathione lyase family enzyme
MNRFRFRQARDARGGGRADHRFFCSPSRGELSLEGTTPMEKETAFPNDFPTDGVTLRCFLAVSNYARSLAFYRDVLGARVLHELPGTLCFLSFAGNQILLSAPFGSTKDKTDSPLDRKSIISELSIQVPDCLAAYELLRSRGAQFITPPFDWREETRAFFLDPDGHLLEIWEAREVEVRSE